jgi:hypothetical protein
MQIKNHGYIEPNTVVGKTSYRKFVIDKKERNTKSYEISATDIHIYIPTNQHSIVFFFIARLTAWSLQCVSLCSLCVFQGFLLSSSELPTAIHTVFSGAMHETWLFHLILFSFTHSYLDATMILNVLACYIVKLHYFYQYHSIVPTWAVFLCIYLFIHCLLLVLLHKS